MHIHFNSDDEQEERRRTHGLASTSAAAAAYVQPHQARQQLSAGFQCVSSVRTDFDQQDQCYVLDLVHSPAAGVVAASLSNRRVKLYKFRWVQPGAGGQ